MPTLKTWSFHHLETSAYVGKGAFPLPTEQYQGWEAALPLAGGALVCRVSHLLLLFRVSIDAYSLS